MRDFRPKHGITLGTNTPQNRPTGKPMKHISREHPLFQLFADLVQNQVCKHVSTHGRESVSLYLTDLLIDFVRTENVFAIKDANGTPIRSIFEMMAEADVRLNASSFDRERQVHKHIGDFILFWSGVYPDYLAKFQINTGELSCNYSRQAQSSYHVVSTFKHAPYQEESELFTLLSSEFEAYKFVLREVAQQAQIYAA